DLIACNMLTSHTIVERRGRKQQRQQNQTISYFFTDIPAGANEANIWKAFAKQGRYLGGLHALLVLEPSTDPNTVLSNKSMHDCFKNIQPWNNKFNLKSKLAWISIEGLPPQAWHEAAFTRLAGEWG
ncbi:hypothetical protein Tco_0135491, partial [Tanacetum coccineum]